MRNLFVIVGTSAIGKSTMVRDFCERKYSFEYFKNDLICLRVRRLFNVEQFGIQNSEGWDKLNEIGNVDLASYYMHTLILMQVKGDTVFSEGYRYYFESERRVLEQAVGSMFDGCRVVYVHLNPSLERRNKFRRMRGYGSITESKLNSIMSKFDTSFCDFEIRNMKGLEEVVSGVVGSMDGGVGEEGGMIDLPGPQCVGYSERCIDNVKISCLNRVGDFIVNNKLVRKVIRRYSK